MVFFIFRAEYMGMVLTCQDNLSESPAGRCVGKGLSSVGMDGQGGHRLFWRFFYKRYVITYSCIEQAPYECRKFILTRPFHLLILSLPFKALIREQQMLPG
jgi:hypothetical protein